MKLLKTTLTAFAAVAVLGGGALTAEAAVSLSLTQGTGGGFGYSWLHTATSPATGTGASMNGTKVQLAVGTNSVSANLDVVNDVLVILGTNPDPLVHGALGSVDASSLRFVGGVLSVKNGVYGGGYIDYQYASGGSSTLVGGTFYFNDTHEVGSGSPDGTSPNSGSYVNPIINIAEWGNNWMYDDGNAGTSLADEWGFLANLAGSRFAATDFANEGDRDLANSSDSTGTRLGIDLRATGLVPPGVDVPEPGSLLVWSLIGLFSVALSRRRR